MRKKSALTTIPIASFTIFIAIALILPSPLALNTTYGAQSQKIQMIDGCTPTDVESSYLTDGYILDQYQTHTNNHRYTAYGWYLVQSFKPSMSLLTKIDVLFEIKGVGSQGEILEMTIKENLSLADEPIASSKISYADLDEKQLWVEFTFDPVTVTPEETYYIFLNQQGAGDCYWYGIYDNDYYERGYSFGYNMGMSKWENLSDEAIFPYFDFCFKTYSYGDNIPPEITNFEGSLTGKANVEYDYQITTVDEDQDDIYLSVDWGDDTEISWTGPYSSNEQVTLSHIWVEKGTYTLSVRPKDSMGNLGEWTTRAVSMPKTRNMFFSFEEFFNAVPLLELLKQLLSN